MKCKSEASRPLLCPFCKPQRLCEDRIWRVQTWKGDQRPRQGRQFERSFHGRNVHFEIGVANDAVGERKFVEE